MLQARKIGLSFAVGKGSVRALDGVSLDIQDGGLTAILGPSGCGKTTLLRVLAGFLRPDSGTVMLDDRVLSGPGRWVKPERRGVGIVPQEGSLFPHLTVGANVGFGLSRGLNGTLSAAARRRRQRRIAEVLELVDLAGFERRRPDELSGGQQQRVALARALAPAPRVVLLDEPFSAVDASLRLDLGRQVTGLLRRIGSTAVLVTHDQAEALSLADRVAVMRDGRVVQVDRPAELYAHPADAATAAFLGEVVLLPGRIEQPNRKLVCCALGELPLACAAPDEVTGSCLVMLRPERLRLCAEGAPARVCDRHFYGHDTTLSLRLGPDGSGPEVLLRTRDGHVPGVGETVALGVMGGVLAYPPPPIN